MCEKEVKSCNSISQAFVVFNIVSGYLEQPIGQ